MASCCHGHLPGKGLNKAGIIENYNTQFKDLINRDCIELVSPQEIEEWESIGGKLSYISHHPVLVPDKATTPCRLVINSSLKNSGLGPSPNDNWPKGPNALKPMHGVFLRFQLYRVAIHICLEGSRFWRPSFIMCSRDRQGFDCTRCRRHQ